MDSQYLKTFIIPLIAISLVGCKQPSGGGSSEETRAANHIPSIAVYCPASALETESVTCDLTVSDPDEASALLSCSLAAGTTCPNAALTSCEQVDIPAPGEGAASGICRVEVAVSDSAGASASGGDSISMLENNQAPTISINCPASVAENAATSCAISVSDNDLPAQTLTCSVDPATTCDYVALSGCASATVPAQGESAGGVSCNVVVEVGDSAGGAAEATDSLAIEKVNENPYWEAEPHPITLLAGGSFNNYNGIASDPDLPSDNPSDPGYLTCEKTAQTCSFDVAVSGNGSDGSAGCVLNFTAGALDENCSVGVKVTDGEGRFITASIPIHVMSSCVIYADVSAVGSGDGLSWANAYNVVQDAVDAATGGCEVWVAQGTYYQPYVGTEPVIEVTSDVDIYGGFTGVETSLSQRGDPADHPTVLDGDLMSENVVWATSNARLDGFTIRGGYGEWGAGIHIIGATDVANCIIEENYARYRGGGISCVYSDAEITNCVFRANIADLSGGGLENYGASITVSNSLFIANGARSDGGAIYNSEADAIITNCVFIGNGAAAYDGGAIFSRGSTTEISIINCTFLSNFAVRWGGAIFDINGANTIQNSVFWDDLTLTGEEMEIGQFGGSFVDMSYSDVEGGFPGATNIDSNPLFTALPDLFDATTTVGAITTIKVPNATLYSISDVIVLNHDGIGRTVSSASGTTVMFSPALDAPSRFGMLVENWGPGATDFDEDLHLQPGSPCIDSGTASDAPASDFDGSPRPSGWGFDMGAYERWWGNICEDTLDNDGDTVIDMGDPGCESPDDSSEYTLTECDDNADNDGDTLKDMGDPGCSDVFDSSEYGSAECDEGSDNDGDTWIDWPDDPGCSSLIDPDEHGSYACDDGVDNDGDTLTDWDDYGCWSLTDPDEHGNNECDDGADNDGDTLTDLLDPECVSVDDISEYPTADCNDGIDNDGDWMIDYYWGDPGCESPTDPSEYGTNECDDGIDNDNDMFVDYYNGWGGDPGCYFIDDSSELGDTVCDDGVDNDGDSFIDFPDDPGCDDPMDVDEYGSWGSCGNYICEPFLGEDAFSCPTDCVESFCGDGYCEPSEVGWCIDCP